MILPDFLPINAIIGTAGGLLSGFVPVAPMMGPAPKGG